MKNQWNKLFNVSPDALKSSGPCHRTDDGAGKERGRK